MNRREIKGAMLEILSDSAKRAWLGDRALSIKGTEAQQAAHQQRCEEVAAELARSFSARAERLCRKRRT